MDRDTGVEVKDRRKVFKTYPKSFVGTEITILVFFLARDTFPLFQKEKVMMLRFRFFFLEFISCSW
jgi:hypothetical protein